MVDPIAIRVLKRLSGLYFFMLAFCAGALIYLPNHNQYTHAFPPAIAVACGVASLAAGATGWLLGASYASKRGRIFSAIWIPAVVYVVAIGVAATAYYVLLPVFLPHFRRTFLVFPAFPQELVVYVLSYASFSFPVWFVGAPISSYALHSKAVAYGN